MTPSVAPTYPTYKQRLILPKNRKWGEPPSNDLVSIAKQMTVVITIVTSDITNNVLVLL